MKILIVCSYKIEYETHITPFIKEQVDALINEGVEVEYFLIQGKGIIGYLRNFNFFKNKIKEINPDLIHAHFGLSGLFANFQRKVPVVTTYHGSDINNKTVFIYSKLSVFFSRFNIFVSQKSIEKVHPKKNYALIPCGVNFDIFKPLDKKKCRENIGFIEKERILLFAGAFDDPVKNYSLGKEAIALLPYPVRLIELKNYTRNQVCELMNSSDGVLMTSFTEGSPQFIKEAMACNCPIVATDVADVAVLMNNTAGCYLTSFDPEDVANKIEQAIQFGKRTDGRQFIKKYDNKVIVQKILTDVYYKVLKK
jgi:glycosyltransferase involved in cell wall biosynthesis